MYGDPTNNRMPAWVDGMPDGLWRSIRFNDEILRWDDGSRGFCAALAEIMRDAHARFLDGEEKT